MIDQYGEPVPDDLVMLPLWQNCDHDERHDVFSCKWYVPAGYNGGSLVMASAEAMHYLSDFDPIDADVDLDAGVEQVASALKRGNDADGFYHA